MIKLNKKYITKHGGIVTNLKLRDDCLTFYGSIWPFYGTVEDKWGNVGVFHWTPTGKWIHDNYSHDLDLVEVSEEDYLELQDYIKSICQTPSIDEIPFVDHIAVTAILIGIILTATLATAMLMRYFLY